MQKQLTPDAAFSTKATSVSQSADVSHHQVDSLQETRATTLQLAGNDFPVRITSAPSDYIGPTIQIIVAVFAATASALVIIWQMRSQKIQADKQHVKTIKAELRLNAYRDYQVVSRNFSDTHTVNTQILLIRSAFSAALAQHQNICFQSPLIQRSPAFMEAMGTKPVVLLCWGYLIIWIPACAGMTG